MIPFNAETEVKHGLKQVGKKFVFSINGVDPEDAGMYQVEVNGVKIFSTDLKSKALFRTVHCGFHLHIAAYAKYNQPGLLPSPPRQCPMWISW